jgi:surface protein
MPTAFTQYHILVAAKNAWLADPAAAEVTYGHIKDWDVSGVNMMFQLFDAYQNASAANFNDDISNWDTSNVTNMQYMFRGCIAFNQNIGNWNTEKVTDMRDMFNWAKVFNQPIRGWKPGNLLTAGVTDMTNMFSGNTTAMGAAYNPTSGTTGYAVTPPSSFFNQTFQPQPNTTELQDAADDWVTPNAVTSYNGVTIEKWDTSQVTDMSGLFQDNTTFNEDISGWNTTGVTNMSNMFKNAAAFNQDIGSWNTAGVTDMTSIFTGATDFSMHITFTNS